VAINCAAIPENMLESVLFGYERGAFTGAHQSKAGKFEQAQGGTLLLDEITEMDLGLQAKLLRVLQEREVERIGGRKMIALDVRILATTNRDIRQAVAEGDFREDLFYRLNVFPLHVLALRERNDDVLPLAKQMLHKYTEGMMTPALTSAAMSALKTHHWPGNVRELDNVIQRALIMRSGDVIDIDDIQFEQVDRSNTSLSDFPVMSPLATDTVASGLNKNMKSHEKELIISALRAKNSRKEVAEKLGISPRTLRYKLAKLRDAGVALPA
jgi:two-component system response regulator FlrC